MYSSDLPVYRPDERQHRPRYRALVFVWVSLVSLLAAYLLSGCAPSVQIVRGPLVTGGSARTVARMIRLVEQVYPGGVDPTIWSDLERVDYFLAPLPCPEQPEASTRGDRVGVRLCGGYMKPTGGGRALIRVRGCSSLAHELIHFVDYRKGIVHYTAHPPDRFYEPGSVEVLVNRLAKSEGICK